MQTSVFCFWQLLKEEASFLQFLHDEGAVALFDRRYAIDEDPQIFPVLDCAEIGQGDYLFTRNKDVSTLVRSPVPRKEKTHYAISHIESCVLTYRRGQRLRIGLSRSSLNFCKAYWDEKSRWTKKPDEFLAWARKVQKWLRTRTPTQLKLRTTSSPATAAVAAAVEKRRLKLSL
jgi:hypothetical protein